MSQPASDPGAEPGKIGVSKLPSLMDFIRRHPDCTLRGGEGKLLLDEIDRKREPRTRPVHRNDRQKVWCCIYVVDGESHTSSAALSTYSIVCRHE
jgi:hypothetical protein